MSDYKKVSFVSVDEQNHLQRIDNFLRTYFKGLPKSRVYRLIRKGEVRVNKKRVAPDYKLVLHDQIRIPPVQLEAVEQVVVPSRLDSVQQLSQRILYEDDGFLVLDKPAGFAVHGGSGVQYGVIEALRALRPDAHFLELVHRLDRDTSGCLLIAKKRSVLRQLHEDLRQRKIQKSYQALVSGQWPESCRCVRAPLLKHVLSGGQRFVRVHTTQGKPSETRYRVLERWQDATLVEASPITGRTHQIRVHCQHVGHPILGDERYGNKEKQVGIRVPRLFLHASAVKLVHPIDRSKSIQMQAHLDKVLAEVLVRLSR